MKEVNNTINDRVDVQNRFPVLTQDVETHISLEVDVGVVNLGGAGHLGRLVGVVVWDHKAELVRCPLP